MPKPYKLPFFQKVLTGFVLSGSIVFIPITVFSAKPQSATLQWAANSESDLAGYRVYQGTAPGSYGLPHDVGNITEYTASKLQAGMTYYFAVTAYDVSGNESAPSSEVFFNTSGTSSNNGGNGSGGRSK